MSGNYIGNNPNGIDIFLSDSHETNNPNLISSTKCVHNSHIDLKEYCDQLKDMIENKGEGLPLGHIYLWPFSTPPDGSIQVNGSTYSRELYSDLWNLIQEKGWYKPEAEWQQIASENGGYCPWYSDGDGSTTFRTPKFAPYQKLALASGDAGKYYEAGLPNITGTFGFKSQGAYQRAPTGVFYNTGDAGGGSYDSNGTGHDVVGIDASRVTSIYGNSTTVQPESHDWIVCVVAFGTATNVGSVDVANVMSAVNQVQAGKLDNTTIHLIETWKSSDGASWYRKYSDGWIEQGGTIAYTNGNDYINQFIINFLLEFTNNKSYSIFINNAGDINSYAPMIVNKSSSSIKVINCINDVAYSACWYACGY